MGLEITALYAGLFGLFLLVLSYRVSAARHVSRVGIGAGQDAHLERVIRVQGNFVEYVPTGILLLALLEFDGSQPWVLHFFGAGLLLGRILHAIGLNGSSGVSVARFWGTISTWILLLGLSIANIYRFVI